MSTQYVFVEKERNDQLQELQAFMTKKRDTLIAGIKEFAATHPHTVNEAEDSIFELKHSQAFGYRQPYEEEHIIGSAVSKGFSWRQDNGFHSLKDVQKFLDEHPGFVILNEYGMELTIRDFGKSI